MRRWPLPLLLVGLVGCLRPAVVSSTPASSPVPAARRVEMPASGSQRWRIEDDPGRALVASVYSLPSGLVDTDDARGLLQAVHAADPKRLVLALVDEPLASRLAASATGPTMRLLRVQGGPYSPWPRDPFSFARSGDGAVRVIVRPNVQRTRESDAEMGPELVRDLPSDVDRSWGGARWALSPVPFHNGQVLLTHDVAWVTMHSVEPRALEILGLARVPVETLGTAAGVDGYVAAVERAADELGPLYGRRVRFVHPMPSPATMDEGARVELMRRLAGGAGYDLDSLVALLPSGGERGGGRNGALVADLSLGRRALDDTTPEEWTTFATSYGVASQGKAAIAAAPESPRGGALASFLDLVASRLADEGFAVQRLPLLIVPDSALLAPGAIPQDYFFVTWANVVVERRGDGIVRAEGFAGLIAAGDRMARETFTRAGAKLDLLPPLRASVIRNGGYRCASNQLRAPD